MKELKKGSVKTLFAVTEPVGESPGEGRFFFSDRYSVFDWGEMPDHIRGRGEALCIVGAYFFEKLEEMGISTHYLGVEEGGRLKRLVELEKPSALMGIKLLRVLMPEVKGNGYDYSIYRRERKNFLVPLEVIYRNSLPEGSSVFRRLEEGSLRPEDLGLGEMPKPGQVLEKPILDVSTKLEETDRYLSWDEAMDLVGLSCEEVDEIRKTALLVDELISEEVERLGLFNEDGKVEFGFDGEGNLILADVVGTPDECRFTFEGVPVSKEAARVFYRRTDWYREVEEAKKKDRIGWKELVRTSPPPLPGRFAELLSLMYRAFASELTGRRWFEGVPPLKEVLGELKENLR